MDILKLIKQFDQVETTKEHNGYTYSVGRALTIVILGSLCGMPTVSKIHQWASTERVKNFLYENFGIIKIPCYYWLLSLLKIIKPKSLNRLFMEWTTKLLPETLKDLTISFDGKTIRSTGKMNEYERPLHILSAHLAELGLTIGQITVDEKSNEIPAMRDLLKLIDIEGSMIVADALNCQTETAKVIIEGNGDYLLNVKGNHEILKHDIEDYVQDNDHKANMESEYSREKNGGRIEFRRAFVSNDLESLEKHKDNWAGLACFGAINRQFTDKNGTSNEWHYFISSKKLTADEMLKYARNEWTVESMHWLLDVHFCEDLTRIRDKNVNQNLNIIRKIALNCIRNYKKNTNSKEAISKLMFGCLLDCSNINEVLIM